MRWCDASPGTFCNAFALVLWGPVSVPERTAVIGLRFPPLVSLRQLFYFFPFSSLGAYQQFCVSEDAKEWSMNDKSHFLCCCQHVTLHLINMFTEWRTRRRILNSKLNIKKDPHGKKAYTWKMSSLIEGGQTRNQETRNQETNNLSLLLPCLVTKFPARLQSHKASGKATTI